VTSPLDVSIAFRTHPSSHERPNAGSETESQFVSASDDKTDILHVRHCCRSSARRFDEYVVLLYAQFPVHKRLLAFKFTVKALLKLYIHNVCELFRNYLYRQSADLYNSSLDLDFVSKFHELRCISG